MTDAPFRVLPALDDDNRFFWTSGSGKTLFDPNPGVQLFGYFANNSQLTFRLTRQF